MIPGDPDAGPDETENFHRSTAANWHGGQNSPLYAYASTGSVIPKLDLEIRDCIRQVEAGHVDRETDSEAELGRLTALLHHVEPKLAIREATIIGEQHGLSAAEWWYQEKLGGLATGDQLRASRIYRGIQDGDPVVLYTLPGPRTDYGQSELEDDCDWAAPVSEDWEALARWQSARPGIRDAYEDAFRSTVMQRASYYCQTELLNARWERIQAGRATRSLGRDGVSL